MQEVGLRILFALRSCACLIQNPDTPPTTPVLKFVVGSRGNQRDELHAQGRHFVQLPLAATSHVRRISVWFGSTSVNEIPIPTFGSACATVPIAMNDFSL